MENFARKDPNPILGASPPPARRASLALLSPLVSLRPSQITLPENISVPPFGRVLDGGSKLPPNPPRPFGSPDTLEPLRLAFPSHNSSDSKSPPLGLKPGFGKGVPCFSELTRPFGPPGAFELLRSAFPSHNCPGSNPCTFPDKGKDSGLRQTSSPREGFSREQIGKALEESSAIRGKSREASERYIGQTVEKIFELPRGQGVTERAHPEDRARARPLERVRAGAVNVGVPARAIS